MHTNCNQLLQFLHDSEIELFTMRQRRKQWGGMSSTITTNRKKNITQNGRYLTTAQLSLSQEMK